MESKMNKAIVLLILACGIYAVTGSPGAWTQSVMPTNSPDNRLVVDIHEFKPMVIDSGKYKRHGEPETRNISGHDIDFWNMIGNDLNLKFEYNFLDSFSQVMPRLKERKADVSIGGLTIMADRAKDADFIPYMRSGAGVLILKEIRFFIKIWLNILFYVGLVLTLIPFFLVWATYVCSSALLVWQLEKGNPDFNDKFGPGFPDARFFVHVIITSTGLGNQIPLSKWGKRVAVVLMYSGIYFMCPIITGKITTEMGKKNLTYISCKENLKGKRVAVKAGTVTAKSMTLQNVGAELVRVKDVAVGVKLLKDKKVDAVVHDKPALEYAAKDKPELFVVDELFDIQIYGIALQNGSLLREKIANLVLEYEEDGTMDELAIKWLGNPGD
jgi:polar amino acid transport system substrate-binding protein